MILFGVKLITIPYIVIPLDQKPPKRAHRPSYFPEFGQNVQEGYYGRFPYEFPIGQDAASYVQVSATQKLGERLRFEQEYLAGKQARAFDTSGYGFGGGYSGSGSLSSDPGGAFTSAYGYGNIGPRLPQLGTGLGPASGGLFTIQGYTSSGFNRNFTTSFRHQQGIGSDNRFGFSTELTKQSYLVSSGQTTQNTRFDLAHDDSVHGVNLLGSINIQTNELADLFHQPDFGQPAQLVSVRLTGNKPQLTVLPDRRFAPAEHAVPPCDSTRLPPAKPSTERRGRTRNSSFSTRPASTSTLS